LESMPSTRSGVGLPGRPGRSRDQVGPRRPNELLPPRALGVTFHRKRGGQAGDARSSAGLGRHCTDYYVVRHHRPSIDASSHQLMSTRRTSARYEECSHPPPPSTTTELARGDLAGTCARVRWSTFGAKEGRDPGYLRRRAGLAHHDHGADLPGDASPSLPVVGSKLMDRERVHTTRRLWPQGLPVTEGARGRWRPPGSVPNGERFMANTRPQDELGLARRPSRSPTTVDPRSGRGFFPDGTGRSPIPWVAAQSDPCGSARDRPGSAGTSAGSTSRRSPSTSARQPLYTMGGVRRTRMAHQRAWAIRVGLCRLRLFHGGNRLAPTPCSTQPLISGRPLRVGASYRRSRTQSTSPSALDCRGGEDRRESSAASTESGRRVLRVRRARRDDGPAVRRIRSPEGASMPPWRRSRG